MKKNCNKAIKLVGYVTVLVQRMPPPPVPQQWLQFLVSAQGVPQRSMMKFHSAVLHPGNGCSQTQVLPKRGEMNEERL